MMSKSLGTRPSDVYGFTEPIERYAFDSSVVMWGTAFDSALEEAVSGATSKHEAESKLAATVRRWLPSKRRYADPSRR